MRERGRHYRDDSYEKYIKVLLAWDYNMFGGTCVIAVKEKIYEKNKRKTN